MELDYWLLGITLFKMLHGVTPFEGPRHIDVLADKIARLDRTTQYRENLSEDIKDLINGLLCKSKAGDQRLRASALSSSISHGWLKGYAAQDNNWGNRQSWQNVLPVQDIIAAAQKPVVLDG